MCPRWRLRTPTSLVEGAGETDTRADFGEGESFGFPAARPSVAFHQGVPLVPVGSVSFIYLDWLYWLPRCGSHAFERAARAGGIFRRKKFPDDVNVVSLWKVLWESPRSLSGSFLPVPCALGLVRPFGSWAM